MVETVKFLCPHCGQHLFDTQTAAAARPAAGGGYNANGNGNGGGDGAVAVDLESESCPRCGKYKRPGYAVCFDCASADYDECPRGCGRKKKKRFPTCYTCGEAERAQGGVAQPAGAPAGGGHTNMAGYDDDDAPF